MTVNDRINQLLDYGISHHLFKQDDMSYVISRIKYILKIDHFKRAAVKDESIEVILSGLCQDQFELIPILVDCLLPRPSELYVQYRTHYRKSPRQATDFFYEFSKNALNVLPTWETSINEATLEINDLTLKCLTQNKEDDTLIAPTLSLRTMPISFNNEKHVWQLQYLFRPYFNEQAMVYRLAKKEINDSESRYNEMLNFLNRYPHYCITPSIDQSTYTFDGQYLVGRNHFPIEEATLIKKDRSNRVGIELLDWYLPTVKLISNNENRLLDMMHYLERAWVQMDLDRHMILPFMLLDGIKFNVYIYFIDKEDLAQINGFSASGIVCLDESASFDKTKGIIQSLADKNIFKNRNDDFVSFIEKAI